MYAYSEKYVTTKDNKQVLDLSQETCKDSACKKIQPVFSEMNRFKESELYRNNTILVFNAQLKYQKRYRTSFSFTERR